MEVEKVKSILKRNLAEGVTNSDIDSGSEVSKAMRCLKSALSETMMDISLDQSMSHEERGVCTEAISLLHSSIKETFATINSGGSTGSISIETLERD